MNYAPGALPESWQAVEHIKRGDGDGVLSFQVDVAGVQLNCHCFCSHDIELDIAPAQVDGQTRFDTLVGFMRRMGQSRGKPVVLTPENMEDAPFLSYSPATDEVALGEYSAAR